MKQKFYHQKHSGNRRFPRKIQSASKADLLAAIASVEVIKKEHKTDENIIPVEKKFEDFSLSSVLLENIQNKGYERPTPIQQDGIPAIQSGQDVIGSNSIVVCFGISNIINFSCASQHNYRQIMKFWYITQLMKHCFTIHNRH